MDNNPVLQPNETQEPPKALELAINRKAEQYLRMPESVAKDPQLLDERTKEFLGSLTPEERSQLEEKVYGEKPAPRTYGSVDRPLTEGLIRILTERGMLKPGCTGERPIEVVVINNPEAELVPIGPTAFKDRLPIGPTAFKDRLVVIPRETLARTPPGKENSLLAVAGHEIYHAKDQHELRTYIGQLSINDAVGTPSERTAALNNLSQLHEGAADKAGGSPSCGVPGGIGSFFLYHPDSQIFVEGPTHPFNSDRIGADDPQGLPQSAPGSPINQLRLDALRAEGEEQRTEVERQTAGAVTVDLDRAALSPQQMVDADRLALKEASVKFVINDGTHHLPVHRQVDVTVRGSYYPLHVNGELKRMTVIQPLQQAPADPASLTYTRETPQGLIISAIGSDPTSGKPTRELSFEPRKPSKGKEVIHLSRLSPEERSLFNPFNHLSHESRPDVPRPEPKPFPDDF